jgi:hypothetical protein
MGKIDKTRDNINVDSLHREERRELFNKLVKAGGQVIREKPKNTIRIDRSKQKEIQQRLDNKRKQNQWTEQQPSAFSRTMSSASVPKPIEAPLSSGFALLFLRLKLYLTGVSNLGGTYFKKKFLEKFKVEFNPALMELQMLYLDLFKQNPNMGWQIVEQLDKMRPLYFELIEMSADVYEIGIAARLLDSYAALPHENYRIVDYKSTILEYFRRLYLLHKYVDSIDFAFEKAIALQHRMEKDKSSLYSTKRKKAGNSLYIIFNKMFPKLYRLTCLIQGENLDIYDTRRIDEMFGILPEMKPGKRIPNQPSAIFTSELAPDEKTEATPEGTPPTDEEEKQNLPEEITRGLALMQTADLDAIRQEITRDDLLANVSETDKVLYAYLLFYEFDREYAFIFTTYKIKFNPAYSIRGKSDYRSRLSEVYNQIRSCYDVLKEYFISLEIYEKVREDRPTSHDQYFSYTKRLGELDREKKAKSRMAKTVMQNYLGKILEETNILINDINQRRTIIQNPQDLLEFDSPVDQNLKMKGKMIYEAIYAAYDYASALYYRLSPGGDIYNDQTPLIDLKTQQHPETAQPAQPAQVDEPIKEPEKQSSPGKEKTKDDNSILGELDDLL